LERMVEYAVVKKDNEIIISLEEGEAKAEPEVKPAPVAVPEVKLEPVIPSTVTKPAEIKVEPEKKFYLLNDILTDGNEIEIVTTGAVKYNIFKITNPPKLVVELTNVEHNVPSKKEFIVNGPIIKSIRSSQFKNEPVKIARVVLDLNNMVDYTASGKDNGVKISLIEKKEEVKPEPVPVKKEEIEVKEKPPVEKVVEKPKPEVKKPAKVTKKEPEKVVEKKKPYEFPKTPVTLEYQDAEITDVLQIMAIRSGVNIIYGDDVKGTITISLNNVPFDDAFKTILRLKGLTSIPISANVIRVITPQKLVEERQLAVSFSKIFPLNYAKADQLKAQLNEALSAQSQNVTVTVDARTNSIIVTASVEGLDVAEKLISELDKKPYQVSIEAKLVDVSLNDLFESGINWKYYEVQPGQAGAGATVAGGAKTVGPVTATDAGVTAAEIKAGGAEAKLTMPASGGMFSFGQITDTKVLNSVLAILATQNKTKVLSAPRVTSLNNEEARILVGEKVPYKTTTMGAGGVSQETWEFLDAGVKLTVTPLVNPDGYITLKVRPEVSVPQAAAPGAAPTVSTREAEVTVMVRDNDTLVIGGLINENDIKTIQKIPILGDLPILGYLFKYKQDSKRRSELLIFITPKIIEG